MAEKGEAKTVASSRNRRDLVVVATGIFVVIYMLHNI